MSAVIARVPSRQGQPELEVVVATTQAEQRALFRLRYDIYVRKMGLLALDHAFVQDDQLVDPYDAWSTNLLLRANGVPAGSIRFTERRNGPLEIDQYTDASARCPAPMGTLEVTRFMVRRDLHTGRASPLLLYAMWKLLSRSTSHTILAAGKLGKLGQYYKNVCAAGLTVAPTPFEYGLTGCKYELLIANIGRLGSPRRLVWRAHIQALALMTFQLTPIGSRVVKRGTRGLPTAQSPLLSS